MRRLPNTLRRSRQKGVVLIMALILLLILTLIGVTAARMQTVEERMAQNDDNHQLAIQAAEATLRSAEGQLESQVYGPADFAANAPGLYILESELQSPPSSSTPGTVSIAESIDWTKPGAQTRTYGGAPLANAPPAPQSAQFLVESFPPGRVLPGNQLYSAEYGQQQQPVAVYRITAHAVGGDKTSAATLQSILVLQ
jgi:type IV pilus assembly protein PilX